jgi:hypothetical protein
VFLPAVCPEKGNSAERTADFMTRDPSRLSNGVTERRVHALAKLCSSVVNRHIYRLPASIKVRHESQAPFRPSLGMPPLSQGSFTIVNADNTFFLATNQEWPGAQRWAAACLRRLLKNGEVL